MTEANLVALVIALIGAAGTVAASFAGLLAHRSRKEQRLFQEENTLQHGLSMGAILEIGLVARETRQDMRELKADFRDHVEDGHSKSEPKKATVKKASVTTKALKKK